MSARVPLFALFIASFVHVGCASDNAPASTAKRGLPAGIGRTDDGKVIGPFADGQALTIQAYKSTEAGGTVNSWLLMGKTNAALIDAQLIESQAAPVVKMIQDSGRNLQWIWVTHGHPDHSTGLGVIAKAFPDAKIVAHPRVAAEAPSLFEKYKDPLNRFFPGDIPEAPTLAAAHAGDTLELEGVRINVLTFEDGEAELTTALHIPSMRALFCADMIYNNVHPWLNEMRVDGVLAHAAQLEGMSDVDTFYPGHGEPFGKDYIKTYREYVNFFMSQLPLAKDANDLMERVYARYPWRTMAGLRFSANAYIDARSKPSAE